ncbi:MAG: single-stranded DNA-binding protein, partial [Psychrobacter sp.]|nr:single-stranded DNA-binding protein [Psychrobacter sp.]
MDLNRITILGNLGGDPSMTVFDNGDKIAKLMVATNSYWTDKKS